MVGNVSEHNEVFEKAVHRVHVSFAEVVVAKVEIERNEERENVDGEPLQALQTKDLLLGSEPIGGVSWPEIIDQHGEEHVQQRADHEADERTFVNPFDFARRHVGQQQKEGELEEVNGAIDDLCQPVELGKGDVLTAKHA